MGYTYSFVNNVAYGVDDFNAISERLSLPGVSPIMPSTVYYDEDINQLTGELAAEGIIGDNCKCTLSGVGTAEMTITVAPGVVIFENGATLTIDNEGVTLNAPASGASKIYAHFNVNLEKAEILCTEDYPDTGYYVPLANITAANILIDTRVFAKSKLAGVGSNLTRTVNITSVGEAILYAQGESQNSYIIGKAANVSLTEFNYAQIGIGSLAEINLQRHPYLHTNGGLFDLETGRFLWKHQGGDIWNSTDNLLYTYGSFTYYIQIIGGEICYVMCCTANYYSRYFTPSAEGTVLGVAHLM